MTVRCKMIMVNGKPVRARASGVLSDTDLEAVKEFQAFLAGKSKHPSRNGLRLTPSMTEPDQPDPEV